MLLLGELKNLKLGYFWYIEYLVYDEDESRNQELS
jgi:hypothetical protein